MGRQKKENKIHVEIESNDCSDQIKGKNEKTTTGDVNVKKLENTIKRLQKKVKKSDESLKQTQNERNEYHDKYLRNLAEFDNFRKRMKKEKEEFQRFVLGDFILGLLEILDNLERALVAAPSSQDSQSLISGVKMIHRQMIDYLQKNRVEEIESMQKPFDPNFHQALAKEEDAEISEPTVVEVYQKGFLYGGKLLRPTLAKVAVPVDSSGDGNNSVESEEE